MRIAGIIVCALMIAGPGVAENDCGSMLRTMSRFRGTIRSVRPLAAGETIANDVAIDPSFVVTIEHESGEMLTFAIHSPARTFGTGDWSDERSKRRAACERSCSR